MKDIVSFINESISDVTYAIRWYYYPNEKMSWSYQTSLDRAQKAVKRMQKRFLKISCYFDLFIAHTHESKKEILEHFYIDGGRVAVVHHGVFEPELGGLERNEAHERLRLIS